VKEDLVEGPETLIGAEVYLAHGDQNEIAKIIKLKWDNDRNLIGQKHINPVIYSRTFIIFFPDGDQDDIGHNVLAESIYSQIDSEGKQFTWTVRMSWAVEL
jgi:pyruvate/2-oxoacid:ferredoxin oxidoreductase beta subunit